MKMKERIEMLEKRLHDADTVIAYYANTHTYGMYPFNNPLFTALNMVPSEDHEVIQPFLREPAKVFAGKKAREYQKKYTQAKV
jgi:hypothetical protein